MRFALANYKRVRFLAFWLNLMYMSGETVPSKTISRKLYFKETRPGYDLVCLRK